MPPRCTLRPAVCLALALAPSLPHRAAAREPLSSFADVLDRAEPAVVNIATVGRAEEAGEQETMQDFLHRFFGEGPRVQRSLGSGFIISPDGEIVTNNHVVQGAAKIRVRMANEEELEARVVGSDSKTDVALLRVKAPRPLPTLPFGDSDAVKVGDWVLAIGNPFGLTQTATAGIVSAKGRFLGEGPYDDFIQTDASINPGNSGGPLVNAKGEAVGLNSAIFTRSGGSVGIGFAVPINMAKFVVPQLADHGSVTRGWLGVTIQPLTADLAKTFGVSRYDGALVSSVFDGSPAARIGVKSGDIIVEFDGQKISRTTDLSRLVAATPVGKGVTIRLIREGKPLVLTPTIARLTDKEETAAAGGGAGGKHTKLGLAVEPLTPDIARQLGVSIEHGLVVREVQDGSPAAEAGIRPGDVISEVDRQPVNSVEDLRRAVEKRSEGKPTLLLVHRQGSALFLTIKS